MIKNEDLNKQSFSSTTIEPSCPLHSPPVLVGLGTWSNPRRPRAGSPAQTSPQTPGPATTHASAYSGVDDDDGRGEEKQENR